MIFLDLTVHNGVQIQVGDNGRFYARLPDCYGKSPEISDDSLDKIKGQIDRHEPMVKLTNPPSYIINNHTSLPAEEVSITHTIGRYYLYNDGVYTGDSYSNKRYGWYLLKSAVKLDKRFIESEKLKAKEHILDQRIEELTRRKKILHSKSRELLEELEKEYKVNEESMYEDTHGASQGCND